MALSAFGVEHITVEKALTGQSGDKRNTKYAGAAYGGAVAGGLAGRRIGARAGGSTLKNVRTASHTDLAGSIERGVNALGETAGPKHRTPTGPIREGMRQGFQSQRGLGRAALKDIKAVPGGRAMIRGNRIGLATGAATGAAAYGLHRHRQNVGKSAFGVEYLEIAKDDTKPSAGRTATAVAFPWIHSAAAGKKGKRLAAAGSMTGHGLVGGVLGGAGATLAGTLTRKPEVAQALGAVGGAGGVLAGRVAGVHSNQRRGRYKPEVQKSAFGVEHLTI